MMGRFGMAAAAAVVALGGAAGDARAWEADTTHAGLTEQAAAASGLDARLREQLGVELGLFGALIVPPADAPALFEVLGALNPTHGYVPDTRGSQTALAWLVAGSVIADMPVAAARNHFFDPDSRRGLRLADLGGALLARRRARGWVGGDGVAAPDWIVANDNPLALAGFHAQYRKAVTARTPGERERHLAGALIAAGAILHVLQDMGSPSHVRDDFDAHLAPLSDDADDIGSRFERVAALAFGRLGVPAPARVVAHATLRGFFADESGHPERGREAAESKGGGGLAAWTAARFFSAGTLPATIELPAGARADDLGDALDRALARPAPAPLASGLDLIGAARGDGGTLVGEDGVCLARYRIARGRLSWSLDDDCALAQLEVLLPEVSAHSAGALDFLFRGALTVSRSDKGAVAVAAGAAGLGAGALTVLWDDAQGVRTAIADGVDSKGAAAGGRLAILETVPAGAARIAALYVGVDGNGEPIVAAGLLDL